MLYRCQHLVTMDGPPLQDGGVVVRGTTVAAAGHWADVRREFPDEEAEDLGAVTLLPGFVNAHCHLDYSTLRHAILPPKNFSEWVGRINALKRTLDQDDYLAAIARGFREFAKWGTTTVLNIESFPELMWKMPPPPLRTWWFYEMIDVRRVVPTEEIVAGALLFFQQAAEGHCPDQWLGGTGLSPHAPYTASRDLYRLTRACARQTGMPWTTHLGESADERAMFVEGRGPLHAFLAGIGRPMDDCGHGRSALAQLTAAGCLGPECLAVHLNDWEPEDFDLVAPGGPLAGMTVVHCPRSHRYFRHTPFPWARLRGLGVNLCVGTDSPASDGSFSLLDELRAAAEAEPGMTPQEWLETVTVRPARALGLEEKLGRIRPGAWADLAALPCGGSAPAPSNPAADHRPPLTGSPDGNIYAEVLACHEPTVWRMVNGQAL